VQSVGLELDELEGPRTDRVLPHLGLIGAPTQRSSIVADPVAARNGEQLGLAALELVALS
jgi:hypothetical protein